MFQNFRSRYDWVAMFGDFRKAADTAAGFCAYALAVLIVFGLFAEAALLLAYMAVGLYGLAAVFEFAKRWAVRRSRAVSRR